VIDRDTFATQAALRRLSERYAASLDHRDAEAMVSVFHPDARLRAYHPSESPDPFSDSSGHAALARRPDAVARWAKTFHFLGQSTYEIGDGVATGEVYCVAHHFAPAPGGGATDYVMFIRYQDRYRLGSDGEWRIEDRRALIDWTETRIANSLGESIVSAWPARPGEKGIGTTP
jgi:hypothetical protein